MAKDKDMHYSTARFCPPVDNPCISGGTGSYLRREVLLGLIVGSQGRILYQTYFYTILMNGKALHMISWILIMAGALNWLLVGIGGFAGADWNIVTLVFGSMPMAEWAVYILVGLAGIYEIVTHKRSCAQCTTAPVQQ